MSSLLPAQSVLWWSAGFSAVVLVIFLFEYHRTRARLVRREEQMKHRMYEIAILRELGERIGYSLNVQKIVDVIMASLGQLLPYSTVAYMLANEDGRILFRISLAESVNKQFIGEVRSRMLKAFSSLFGKEFSDKDIDEMVGGIITDPQSKSAVESFFNVPVVINQKPAGILTVASTYVGLYKTSQEVEILYTIMGQASEAVSKLQTVLEIEKGKLNAMVASMADGVLMVDNQNRILVLNPQAKAMLALAGEAAPSIFEVLEALAHRMDLRTKIEESVKKDSLIVEDNVELNNRYLQILISPVKDNKNQPLGSVVLFHDITHEKEIEKMREDFTSMMVHELRSPLTGIRSIASLLKSEKVKNEGPKYQQFVDLISSNSNSMLDLVNDLLDIAKLEAGKFEVFKRPGDLRHVIKQRIQSFQGLAAENKIALAEQVLPEVPGELVFDENKIAQVLNNLISNALKFTEAGGQVTVSAFVCDRFADLSGMASAKGISWQGPRSGVVCPVGAIVVGVSDTGTGIPASEIPRLFNKFQQLSTARTSQKKGTGLGLVIVKGILAAHGGTVGVFSEEGKGTTFYFTLPLEDTAQKAAVTAQAGASLTKTK